MKKELSLVISLLLLCPVFNFAQTSNKSFSWNPKSPKDNVVMTWNKNTPEQEMKDDIKALSEYGVTIKYNNVKRNAKNEITAINVSFEDKNGNKGSLSYDNKNPISTIKFFKNGDEVGFGNAGNSFDGNPFITDFPGNENFLKEYNFNFDQDSLSTDKFEFKLPNAQSFGQSKSKIIIKKDGKKPLVIEDGEVVEGGEDYSLEEIEEIKKNNPTKRFNNDDIYNFRFNGNSDLAEQMKKMQQQIDQLMQQSQSGNKSSIDKDLEDSKKELEEAKEELEKAKKELQKTKKGLKTQKA
ncbi:hypothetical protein IVB69_05115 [Flavobacterium sp. J49]|uniref:hypothetical protein n=1 Tax=Flavobacterium sp. J49 TaxID=2718534 RepID=UPI001593DFDA|nr:hypothetical protein [Flavobacterium sp. J49]MBF6640850.1 hypothetical protein [Flavobacterium sp. J49]NIC02097.1 hypothetical protein [Flavobacterium sp. J49]